jgi:2',3'-cyclic-nucleotide 2'-phosphodiesterase (5'-nucleotidase family)
MRLIQRVTFSLLLISFSSLSHARLLQIIHTNDLHSYFTGYYNGNGSYPRVMTKIKELREEAQKKGVEVLQLDAGDWGEGTSYFLANSGADSIRALEMLGTDVATVGNHDHLLGIQSLLDQINRADVRTKFTVANVSTKIEMGPKVTPYVDLEKAGISIRIIGLTTPELYFQYSVAPGKVLSPVPIADAEGKKAKAEGKELVIALTHLGVSQDELVAKGTSDIDVIVGGHTHTKLSSVDYTKNKLGKSIPIVQAWAHGLAVGSLLIDVKDDGSVNVVEYKLHEITSPMASDPDMEAFVANASAHRDQNLNISGTQVIGETKTPMTGYLNGKPVYKSSCWGWHMATAARKAVGAAVGIHVASFEGKYKPAGPITYGDLADNWPHLRKFGDQGWEIATVYMSGLKLRTFMYFISRRVGGITFSGLGYKDDEEIGIDEKGTYRVAIPAEAALAIKTSMPGYQQYLLGLKYTGKYYWPVMVDYIKKNSPISCN